MKASHLYTPGQTFRSNAVKVFTCLITLITERLSGMGRCGATGFAPSPLHK
ncbi:hypothetical protein B932_1452 [Gluconobacter oxydans H24]|nr:hypothetical protein B932_1452 [Gluconobacter oxydans H24]